jgi:formylmethanofuran dehydrogenase subunit E
VAGLEGMEEGEVVRKKREQNFDYAWFNDNPFCNLCFEGIGLRCYKCKEYIVDDYVNLDNGRYHCECLVCSICKKVVGQYLCEIGADLYHPQCYMKNFQKCDFCGDEIMEKDRWKIGENVRGFLIIFFFKGIFTVLLGIFVLREILIFF